MDENNKNNNVEPQAQSPIQEPQQAAPQQQSIQEPVQNIQQTQTTYQAAPQSESKGFAIASMVLGIVSIVCICFWYISMICGLLSLIFGIYSLATKRGGKGMAIAGIVCTIIAILLYILIIVGFVALVSSSEFSDLYEEIYENVSTNL